MKKLLIFLAVLGLLSTTSPALAAPTDPNPGAIWTTDVAGATNVNIYSLKEDVYLNGGPKRSATNGLPDGAYYVQVTSPDGVLLGSSVPLAPVLVAGGRFAASYQLWAIVAKTSDGTVGYDSTPNPGGEYKVWVSQDPTFTGSNTKTDAFKVKAEVPPLAYGTIRVIKFYDANANGLNDDGQLLSGWKVRIQDGIDFVRYTPVEVTVDPDGYVVSEFAPVETNWFASTPAAVTFDLAPGTARTVEFGNYCLAPSGGRTLGFWSNKNGQALINAADLALLRSLNLRNADGSAFDPTTAAQVKSWLLSASATNMACMLSVQLTAMTLSAQHGFVNAASFYIPAGQKITDLTAAANAALGADGLTLAGHASRSAQETLKNHLDALNNGASVVPPAPGVFTFAS